MPLYIKDETTTQLVNELAKRRGTTKQEAVKRAVQAELERDPAPVSLVEKVKKFWAEHPLPPATGKIADKAFFDELSGEGPDGEALTFRLQKDTEIVCSAISVWETITALCYNHNFSVSAARLRVSELMLTLNLQYVPIGEREAELAARAYEKFGKGQHPAALNMGDCFAYACAKANNAKLLFKGDDFAKTDISAA